MVELELALNTYDFPPELIFNFDETMLDSSGHKVKVLIRAHDPRPFTENETKMEHITLGLCISAAGTYVKPLCILPLKHLPHLHRAVEAFYSFAGQGNGFICNEIWHAWVETVFIPHVQQVRERLGKPNQKVLLIVDSHSTRKYAPTIKLLNDHNIYTLILPAHSSTILQPLDLTVNGELKRLLKLRFKPKEGEDRATKRNRLLFISVACLQGAFLAIHIQDGFERAGIHPFSVGAPLDSSLVKHSIDQVEFQPPAKRKRGPTIAGKVLTTGNPLPPAILPPTPNTPLPLPPITPAIAPSNSPPQITPAYTYNPSLAMFMNL